MEIVFLICVGVVKLTFCLFCSGVLLLLLLLLGILLVELRIFTLAVIWSYLAEEAGDTIGFFMPLLLLLLLLLGVDTGNFGFGVIVLLVLALLGVDKGLIIMIIIIIFIKYF